MTSKTLNQGLGICHLSPSPPLSSIHVFSVYVCLFFLKLSGHLGIYSVQFKGADSASAVSVQTQDCAEENEVQQP